MGRAVLILSIVAACSGSKPAPDAAAPTMIVAVDRRVEMMTLLCRLAGLPEYEARGLPYFAELELQFGPSRAHAAVTMTRAMRDQHGYGYDACARLAVYVDDVFQPIRALDPRPPGLDDGRFDGVDLDAYLAQVRDFAATTRFDAFFAAHAAYYEQVAGKLRAFLDAHPLLPWFDAVFGVKPGATYRVSPGILTARHNFGVHAVRADGGEDVMQVMFLEGVYDGRPYQPADQTFQLLAHELAHSYVNAIVDAHLDQLADVGATMFARVGDAMTRQAYDDARVVLEESVVRAVSVLYLRDRGTPELVAAVLAEQQQLSFLWTPELVDALAAVRARHGGELPPDELVTATHDALAAWASGSR
jgi:hypothetical protein